MYIMTQEIKKCVLFFNYFACGTCRRFYVLLKSAISTIRRNLVDVCVNIIIHFDLKQCLCKRFKNNIVRITTIQVIQVYSTCIDVSTFLK